MPDDVEPDVTLPELTAPPPRAALRNPVVVVVVVLVLLAAVTAGLVALNGDDFATARIPARPQLPLALSERDLAAMDAMSNGYDIGVPAPASREVQVPVPLTDPGRVATGYRLPGVKREKARDLAKALGVKGDVLTYDGQHHIADKDRLLLVGSRAGSFSLVSGVNPQCSGDNGDFDGACATGGPVAGGDVPQAPPAIVGGKPVFPTTTTTATTTAPDQRPPPDPSSRNLASTAMARVAAVMGGLAGPHTVEPGPGAWTVRMPLRLDRALVAGWEVVLVVDATGLITAANGWLSSPVDVGDYPLVGVDKGIERLRQGWHGAAGAPLNLGVEQPRRGAVDTPSPAAPCPPGATCPLLPQLTPSPGQGCVAPAGSVTTPEDTDGCIHTTEPETSSQPPAPAPPAPLVVSGVRLGHVLSSDGDGAFLAPAYVFTTSEGDVSVIAVADEELSRQYGMNRGEGLRSTGPPTTTP